MAQEPDRLNGTDDASVTAATPAQIERDIERTRADMTETIDALGARFEPAYLKEQAQEAIVDTARSAGTSMMDTMKDNPLPTAIAALSIGWLIANRSSGTPPARQTSYGGRGYAAAPGSSYGGDYSGGTYGGTYAGASRGAQEPSLADQARDRAAGIAGSVSETASGFADSVSETASDLADQARGTAHDVARQAQNAANRAESWLEGQMRTNPLGVGAVAVVAGAFVGMSLPETQVEVDLMGRQASRVVDQAKQVAGEKVDQAKTVASRVADEARGKVGEIAETVKTAAADAVQEVKDVAQTAKDEAQAASSSPTASPPPVGGDSGSVPAPGIPSGDAGDREEGGPGGGPVVPAVNRPM